MSLLHDNTLCKSFFIGTSWLINTSTLLHVLTLSEVMGSILLHWLLNYFLVVIQVHVCWHYIVCNVDLPKAAFFWLHRCKIKSTVHKFDRNVCHRCRDFSGCVVRCTQINSGGTRNSLVLGEFRLFYFPCALVFLTCANFSSMDTYKIFAARCHIQYLLNLYGSIWCLAEVVLTS